MAELNFDNQNNLKEFKINKLSNNSITHVKKEELLEKLIPDDIKEEECLKYNDKKRSSRKSSLNDRKTQFRATYLKNLVESTPITKITISLEVLSKCSIYLLVTLSSFLKKTLNLIFLGHSDDTLLQINSYQIGIILISTLGYDFIHGSSQAFVALAEKTLQKKDNISLYRIYNVAKIYSFLIFILVTLPFCFAGDYVLYFIGIDAETCATAGNFIKLTLIAIFINLFNIINNRFLILLGKSSIVIGINFFVLIIHILSLLTFVYTFQLGAYGAGIGLIISSIFEFAMLTYFVIKYSPFQENGNRVILTMDTSTLQSSKFYIYVKLATYTGFFNFLKHLSLNSIVIGSYYLYNKNDELNINLAQNSQDKTSFTANIILVNYLLLIYYFIKSITYPLNESVTNYLTTYLENRRYITLKLQLKNPTNDNPADFNIRNIKIIIFISFSFSALVSVFNLLFSQGLCQLYIGSTGIYSQDVCNKFSFVNKLYSVFILFDFANNLSNAVLKGMKHHYFIDFATSLSLVTVFFPLGLLLSFSFNLYNEGFWYAYFSSLVVFTVIDFAYLWKLDFIKESARIRKHLLKGEEEKFN